MNTKVSELSQKARLVQAALAAHGLDLKVMELSKSSRTAVQAAQAVNCQLGQIVKSLIFKTKDTHIPVLVAASGVNRVCERKIEVLLGEAIGRADADFVRQQTGFAIGGVAPLGHPQLIRTFIDEDLLQYPQIWAAAGTPNALFELTPTDLERLTQGRVVDVRE